MPFILYNRGTSATGRNLREVLGIRGGSTPPEERVDSLIRWGSTASVRLRAQRTLNPRDAIALASDKHRAILHMDGQHVPVPRSWGATEIPRNFMDYPLLGRAVTHTQGRDIVLCMQGFDVRRAVEGGCNHFTRYIPTDKEFRVHIFSDFGQNYRRIKISEKVLTNPDTYCPWMRNFDHGYTYRVARDLPSTLKQAISDVAMRAVQSLGLHFGAADVLLGEDRQLYVLEVNTGPGLADNSLKLYARKMGELLGVEPNLTLIDEEDEPDEENT